MNFLNRNEKGCGLLWLMVLIAVMALLFSPVAKALDIQPVAFPSLSTVVAAGGHTNLALGGSATARTDGTTGLKMPQGYPFAVEVKSTCATRTNATITAYFAPSLYGTNPTLNTNLWWPVSGGTPSQDPIGATNRVFGTNFPTSLVQGWRYLHFMGFFNNNTNPLSAVSAVGGVIQ